MRILHVFRSPVGGLFRHVCDLITSQAAMGCEIGLICDSATGGDAAETKLRDLAKHCKLGVNRMAISTLPGFGDVKSIAAVSRFAKTSGAELIHGHGAKGGLYARLAAKRLNLPSVYTPHGGSLHYDWAKPPGFVFLGVEKLLRVPRSGVIFVCEFERRLFDRKIGLGKLPSAVIYNGLWPEEFAPRKLARAPTNLLFVAEMRKLKGLDVLLKALSIVPATRRPTRQPLGLH